MSETTKEMQRLLEEVAATPELSGKWRKRCNIWISVRLPDWPTRQGSM